MFNNEHIVINKQYIQLNSEVSTTALVKQLDAGQSVCVSAGQQCYMFTPGDLAVLQSTIIPHDANIETVLDIFQPSPVIEWSDTQTSNNAWLQKLPDQLQRPVIFAAEDGTPAGWLAAGALLKQISRQKSKAELYLNVLLDTMTDAVTAVDQDGKVNCWNDTAAQMYQIPHEHIMGHTISEHFDPESLLLPRILDEGRKVRNMYHKSSEGTHVLINASPITDHAGKIIGGLASEQDITHLVKLNEELSSAQVSIHETLPRSSDPFTMMDGQSHSISKVVRIGKKVAELHTPALLYGEAGAGKEQLARAIHLAGAYADLPFLSINCGAIPPGMLDSELFGFIGGTYSGQDLQEVGKLEQAGYGTLFLNEINQLTPEMQTKLYRAIKSRSFRRYGGEEELPLHTRIIAGSRVNLESLVAEGRFSSELYYALGVVTITVPPLRERREDLSILVHMYSREFALQYHKPIPRIGPEVMLAFARYDWPGNVAELRSVVERCVILSDSGELSPELLPDSFQPYLAQQEYPKTAEKMNVPVSDSPVHTPAPSLKARVTDEEERRRIEEAMQQAFGNKSIAARMLGISRGTLYNKMNKYQME